MLQAGAVLLAYASLCWFFLSRRSIPTGEPASASLLVAYASQGGEAESIARQQAALLGRHQPVLLRPLNQLNESLLTSVHTALFVASTYGEGEPPDNALRFARQWLKTPRDTDLSSLHYAVLALGDSDYRQFCAFGAGLDRALAALGGRRLFDTIRVDRMDSAALRQWQRGLEACSLAEAGGALVAGAAADLPRWPCTLRERSELNPGSPGGPVFHLRFQVPEGAGWEAGDIALFDIPAADGMGSVGREYSIASIPGHGSLDLLVRQVQKPDGTLGLGSGWLTAALPVGSTVDIRVRDNPAFQPPRGDVPMILVGNGTGLAGLRAHLQARDAAGQCRNWLVFGERTRACDRLFDAELQAWQTAGHLPRMDRVFSREGESQRYVQDLLRAEAPTLQAWLDEGACVYVCGSQEGMAPAVHRLLLDLLGEAVLEELVLEGRYRRDVY